MHRNGYLWTSGVLDTAGQIADPISCESAKFRRFGDVFRWFLHFILWMSAIFLLPVCLPTDLESIPHASTPTLIISTKFEVDMTIHCRVRAFLSADTSRDLVTLIFDLLTLNSCSAVGHVGVKNNYTFGIPDPNLPIHYTTLCLYCPFC